MIKKSILRDVLKEALKTGGDFSEIYIENTSSNSVSLIDSLIENINSSKTFGVGLRIYKGLNSVYVYTTKKDRDSLLEMARKAAIAIDSVKKDIIVDINLNERIYRNQHDIEILPADVKLQEKIKLLKSMDKVARNYHSSISQVMASIVDIEKNILICNSEGLFTRDRRIRTRLSNSVIAKNKTSQETGGDSPGYHKGFEVFKDLIDVEELALKSAKMANDMLNAKPVKAGKMPVIIGNKFGGVLFHEACGHSLEATAVAKDLSEFSGKLGQKIASDIVTAYDDGTIENLWGSQNIDDEGNKTRKNVLIENGILKSYMIDRLNARRMKMAVTSNSRRQSYRYAPTSRMTNTFIGNGRHTVDEVISATPKALYAKSLGGGSIHPFTGEFNFSVREAYLVENGKIVEAIKGASLIGKGSEVLKKIDMIANDLDHAAGMCGSVSGSIPVCVGQPTLRVSELVVGGK